MPKKFDIEAPPDDLVAALQAEVEELRARLAEQVPTFDREETARKAVGLSLLREPFEAHQIGTLPKPTKRGNEKGECPECGQYHGLPAVHLSYVGHAHVRERLLDVDPEWTWRPMGFDEHGCPALDRNEDGDPVGMWIWLRVLGVERPGYGSVEPGKTEAVKELIGDALRNAGQSFGIALDLWKKEEKRLRSYEDDDEPPRRRSRRRRVQNEEDPPPPSRPDPVALGWESKETANARHKAAGEAIKALPPEAADDLAHWRTEREIAGWPLSPAGLVDVENWIAEWQAGEAANASAAE